VACGLYWTSANRHGAIVAMVAGSVVGLLAYNLIAPYCAAVFSAAVSAAVMAAWSLFQPESFQWSQLSAGDEA
jgi:Na+/proline symporter